MKQLSFALLVLLLLGCPGLKAQPTPTPYAKNSLYFELLGQGLLYSVNYEHRFSTHYSARAGYTSWRVSDFPLIFVLIDFDLKAAPLMLNYLTGRGDHHLELGLGALVGRVKVSGEEVWLDETFEGEKSFILGTGTLAYRHQPRAGGLLFKIGMVAFFHPAAAAFSFGMGLGYVF